MKRIRNLGLAFLMAATVFVACQKDNSMSNGTSEFGVRFEALNPAFTLPVTSTLKSAAIESDSVTWDSAQMVVSTIKFEAKLKSLVTHEDSIEVEYKWNGPQVLDLLDSNFVLGNFVLSPGIYDEIELKITGMAEDAGDQPVFYLSGTYKNNAGSWPVKVWVTQDVYFKTEKENVEVTEEGVDIISVIQIYLDQLMADVDPADLDNAAQTDGVIVISADNNADIYQIIVSNLAHDCRTRYKHKNHGDDHEYDGYEGHYGNHDDD